MKISTVLGLDLGYGSAKCAMMEMGSGRSREIVLPAGAAVATAMPKIDATRCDLKGGEEVLINGVPWAAGVEQQHIQRRARQTHSRYVTTDEYYALYLACLARMGCSRIDVLVTGLPVSQHFGPEGPQLREVLQTRLVGRKHVNARTMVDVGKVVCIAQPLGTYMGMAADPQYKALATNDSIRVLCVDVGFGTVDWVLMSGRSVMDQSSGSSPLATSVILQNTARRLSADLGRIVTADHLDAALRRGRAILPVGLNGEHDFTQALEAEAADVSSTVVAEILSSLRSAGTVDHVIITGGGGSLYEQALREAFPGEFCVMKPKDAVLANAMGYREVALMVASKMTTAAA